MGSEKENGVTEMKFNNSTEDEKVKYGKENSWGQVNEIAALGIRSGSNLMGWKSMLISQRWLQKVSKPTRLTNLAI